MKKIILSFIALLCFSTNGLCEMSSSKSDMQEVKIKISDIAISHPRPRSELPIIEAQVDAMTGLLVMYFNYELGKVAVDVKNSMGQVVSHYSCNTDMEPMAVINVPAVADNYTIDISGPNVEADGYYTISADN